MTGPNATAPLVLILALISLSGCGASSTSSVPSPLGRDFAASPSSAAAAAAQSGDPPAERHGTIPQSSANKEDTPSSLAPSPQTALLRYGCLYTNWQAASLPTVERQLASLAVGPARLTVEQLAASASIVAELARNHVQNRGIVLAIAPGRGPAAGQWIVVTQEESTGTGPYAGLPPTLHVTLASTEHLEHGWVISSWIPRT
jgi:hypothetical protein